MTSVLPHFTTLLQSDNWLELPESRSIRKISIKDIIRIEGIRNYAIFYLNDGSSFLSARTLKIFDEQLADYGFVRIHKANLINLEYMAEYDAKNLNFVTMKNGNQVQISRRKRRDFSEKLNPPISQFKNKII